jgi:uncharacterized protein YigE (DUF2233 family)
MKRVLLIFLGTILFLLMGQEVSFSADFPWQKIEEGFDFKSLQVEGDPYQSLISLKILRISLDKFQVRVLDARAFGEIKLEIKELARKAGALAAINGGFFLPGYKPLGLLIVDGREVNPLRKADWGIFLIQDNSPRIIHTAEYLTDRNISQALQVGPRLVVGGRELQMKKQVARRSALGITAKNQVILLNTEDTDINAQDLARIFHLPESQGGLECRDALTLDGGPSAQMYADYKSLKIDIPGGWGVPNGIGVFKKKP